MSSLADDDVRVLLADAAGRAGRYLADLDERPVVPDGAALAGLARFDEPLPEVAGDPAATLALLDEAGSAATMASAGGRYFGFVIGGSYPVAVAASWLATAWDQNAALPVMSPVAARLHEVVTGWLADLFGLPAGTAAGFVSGASMANTTALAAARDHQLARAGWDVQADGLFGAPELTVIIGEKAHSTVLKALGLLGLGRDRVRRVPADDQGRMRADCLPEDLLTPRVVRPRLLLDAERLHAVLRFLYDLRAAGQDRDFRDNLWWNRLRDEALLDRADLAESLSEMNAGDVRPPSLSMKNEIGRPNLRRVSFRFPQG